MHLHRLPHQLGYGRNIFKYISQVEIKIFYFFCLNFQRKYSEIELPLRENKKTRGMKSLKGTINIPDGDYNRIISY
jgi:hypothetical protein